MYKKMALNGLALLGLLTSTTVLAEIEPGFYAGAGVGKAKVELDEAAGFSFEADDTAFKVYGGYNFDQYFAVEAAYFDGGKPEVTLYAAPGVKGTIDIGFSGVIGSLVGRVPFGDMFSAYGKLGLASYDVKIKGRVNGDVVAEDEVSEQEMSYAFGAALNLSAFELRAEYEIIRIDDGDYHMMTVSGLYRF